MRPNEIFLIIVFLGVPVQAVASSMWCEPPRVDPEVWAERALAVGDTVILGRVYSIKEVPPEDPKPLNSDKEVSHEGPEPLDSGDARSMAELLRLIKIGQKRDADQYDHVVSFEVLKSWKDPIHPIVRTKVQLGRYKELRSFKVGDVYLVIGRELEGTLYRIRSRCTDAIHEAFADDFVSVLDASTRAP